MADNGDSVSSFTTSDDDLFLSTSVDYSTDVAVMVTAFLMHMSILVGEGAPVSFSIRFSMKRGLNSE